MFLEIPLEPQRFSKYKPTSLEGEYIYQLHMEPNLGLPIHLLDTPAFMPPATKSELPVEDEKVFSMPDDSDVRASSGRKVRPSVTWLRRTEYIGNDLFDAVHKVRLFRAIYDLTSIV